MVAEELRSGRLRELSPDEIQDLVDDECLTEWAEEEARREEREITWKYCLFAAGAIALFSTLYVWLIW